MILLQLNILILWSFVQILAVGRVHQEFLKDLSSLLSAQVLLAFGLFLKVAQDYVTFFEAYHLNVLLFPFFSFSLSLVVDNLSLVFLVLTGFLFYLLNLTARSLGYRLKEIFLILWLLEFLLLNSFSCADLLLFYILFEALLLPMYLMIGIWGSQKNKIFAANQFFLYTLLGSFFLLVGILLILLLAGSANIFFLRCFLWDPSLENVLFFLFFVSFAVKVPMFPFHLWLPKAHVEAPTVGSVLLAGVLLKLGSFGFLRYSLFLFPQAALSYSWILLSLTSLAVAYSSFSTLRQLDLKRLVAYSSIAHMNYLMGGLFSHNLSAMVGSLLLQTAHGFSSSALFLCIGFLYERYGTRNLFYYGGLATVMPLFLIFFFWFSLANLGFPGTMNFLAELTIFLGLYETYPLAALCMLTGIFLSALYSFVTLNRLFFGPYSHFQRKYADLSRREFLILLPLALWLLILGLQATSVMAIWVAPLEAFFLPQ